MRRLPAAALCLVTAFALSAYAQQPTPSKPAEAKQYKPIPGFDPAAMDTSANPCVDFYQFACGNFAKEHPIPADLPLFDQFVNLYEFNTQALHQIVTAAAQAHAPMGSNQQKIGDYYSSCMDTAAIDKADLAPVQPELKRIAELKSRAQLPGLIAYLNRMGVGVFVDYGSQQDYKDATKEIAYIDQSGLGLPEKAYYFRTDPKSIQTRKEYVQHVANMLKLLGDSPAEASAQAEKVMALETALAKASQGVVMRRDPSNVYHMETLASFSQATPVLDPQKYIELMGSPAVTELNVVAPGFFAALNKTIADTSLATIRAYLRVHLVDSFSFRLPQAFDREHFQFYGHDLEGIQQQQARWKRCVNATNASLGEALGKLYVRQYFTPDMKASTLQMVHDIEGAMAKDIQEVDWMSPATKQKALDKLHMVTDKIGYPNKWRSYAKLTIRRDDAFGNAVRSRQFEIAYQLDKIGKPVNRDEWQMTPPTVNAYYDPSMNDINFPAGILQPPFYDKNASAATNYGHIGAVVGHELTHGFDDQGSRFDGKGNLHNWWTPQDKKNFEARTACLVNEYSQFEATPGVKVNGKLTLGENTADNGGIRLALMALMAREALSGLPAPATAEQKSEAHYTQQQQFFIAFAQNWCTNERPQFLRMLAQTDPHSPDAIRVRGVLVNMPQFARAFDCRQGQPMVPAKSCRVW